MRAGATLAVAPLRLTQPPAVAALQPQSCMPTKMASHPQELGLWGQRPLAQLALLSLRCALCTPHLPPLLGKFALPAAACAALPDFLNLSALQPSCPSHQHSPLIDFAPLCAAARMPLCSSHQPSHQPYCTALPVADCRQERPSGQMDQRRAPEAARVAAAAADAAERGDHCRGRLFTGKLGAPGSQSLYSRQQWDPGRIWSLP